MTKLEPIDIRNDGENWRPRPTLSSADYASAETWEQEKERIWWGDWVCVGRAEELPEPGDYIVRDIAGESIFIVKNEQGELRAFYNVCSHRGTKFLDDEPAQGHVRKVFKCPYHAWTFDMNGSLVGSPNVKEDEYFDRSDYPLYDITVEDYEGFVFVNMSQQPRPLMEQLTEGAETMTVFGRYRMSELRIGVRLEYEVAANWKIIVENYNECLHCPTVHPELVQVVPLFRFGEVWDGESPDDGNPMIDGASSFTPTGTSSLPKLPGLNPTDHSMYFGIFEFPNMMLNLHPDCAMYYLMFPMGPNRTRVVSEYLFRPETIESPDFDPQPVVEFWDLISKQDWHVCERAQMGVSSRAFKGGVYPRQDRFLYWFNQEWRQKMGRPTSDEPLA
jgi:Rieske 2Fe-2S family protein